MSGGVFKLFKFQVQAYLACSRDNIITVFSHDFATSKEHPTPLTITARSVGTQYKLSEWLDDRYFEAILIALRMQILGDGSTSPTPGP
jgi:hypothetical protein